jgi:hypothetical protein
METGAHVHVLEGPLRQGREIEGLRRHRIPDKSVLGDAKNVKLRFDSSVMQLAADGKL